MKRFAAWFLGLLLGLLLLLAGAGLWLASTDTGSERLLRLAEYLLNPALHVGTTSGRIGESFCADTVSYETDTVRVKARQLCVGVDLFRLAFGDEALLRVASARELEIATRPAQTPTATTSPLDFVLPVRVVVPHLVLDQLTVNATQVTGIELAASASGGSAAIDSARGVFRGYRITLHGQYGWRQDGKLDLDATVSGADLDVDLTAQGPLRDLAWGFVGRQPVVAMASGRVNLLDDALPYSLSVSGDEIALAPWLKRPLTIGGMLTGNGDLSGYRFGFRGRLDHEEFGRLTLKLAGAGDWESAHAELSAGHDDGRATGTARVQWRPALDFDATLALSDIDLANEYTEVLVSGDLQAAGTASQVAGTVTGLRGVVNDVAFTGSGQLRWSPDNLEITELLVQVGSGELSGRVQVHSGSLDADLAAKNLQLADLDARVGGNLDGRVAITGRWPELGLGGQLTVLEPRFEDYAASSVQITMAAGGERPLRATASGVVAAGRPLGDFRVDASGMVPTGKAELAWQREQAHLQTHVDYRWHDAQLDGDLAVLELQLPGAGLWRGADGAAFSYRSGALQLARMCLSRMDGAQLCAAVAYPDGETRLQLEGIDLHEMPLLEGGPKVSVAVAADATFSRLAPEPEGALQVRLADLEVALDPDVDPYRLGTLQGSAGISSAGVRGRLVSDAAAGVTLDLEFATAGLQSDAPLSGEGRIDLQDLTLLDPFLPDEVGELRGAFAGRFELLGRLNAPLWSGNLTWTGGQLRIVPIGTLLTDVDARISAQDELTAEVRLGAGEGKVTVAAGADEVGLGALGNFHASIAMQRAKLVDLPDYQVWVSGDVAAERRDDVIRVTGTVEVPEASIIVKELPEEAVSASSDVVVAEDEPGDRLDRRLDLTVGFGKAVRVKAYGLDTGVVGQLRVTESRGRLRQVNGTLDLKDGTFSAYGQDLVIQRGRLIFNGPVDNPSLNVVAQRKVKSGGETYEILLTLTGPARRITTRVSSQPVTSEADALSLLVTGRRLTDSSQTERTNLAAAARVLGIKSASLLSDRVGGLLGLDEVIVEGNQENLEVGAGVHINPNLYLRYTYDVFSRLGGVLLNYQLTKNLSLHGKSGDAQSIHLNYEVNL